MEYPGRYTRWDIAFADPCLVIVTRGRGFAVEALNERGRVLLPASARPAAGRRAAGGRGTRVRRGPRGGRGPGTGPRLRGGGAAPPAHRVHRVRAFLASFGCEDSRLGLYGAFGYDLAFQFEPVRLRLDRPCRPARPGAPPARRDLRTGPQARGSHRYVYEFEVDGASTAGAAPPDRQPHPRRPRSARRLPPPGPAGTAQARGHTPRSWRRPGSGSRAATCSRSCPATSSTAGAPCRRRSTNGCASATRRPSSSSSTSARASTWSARPRRCLSG